MSVEYGADQIQILEGLHPMSRRPAAADGPAGPSRRARRRRTAGSDP